MTLQSNFLNCLYTFLIFDYLITSRSYKIKSFYKDLILAPRSIGWRLPILKEQNKKMNIETIASIVSEWAKEKKFILRIWLFGSRAKELGDIDLAFDIKTDSHGGLPDVWAFESDRLKSELIDLLKINVDFVDYDLRKNWIGNNVLLYDKMDNE